MDPTAMLYSTLYLPVPVHVAVQLRQQLGGGSLIFGGRWAGVCLILCALNLTRMSF